MGKVVSPLVACVLRGAEVVSRDDETAPVGTDRDRAIAVRRPGVLDRLPGYRAAVAGQREGVDDAGAHAGDEDGSVPPGDGGGGVDRDARGSNRRVLEGREIVAGGHAEQRGDGPSTKSGWCHDDSVARGTEGGGSSRLKVCEVHGSGLEADQLS